MNTSQEHEEFKKPFGIPKKRSRNGEPRKREVPPTPASLVIESTTLVYSVPTSSESLLEKGYRL
jgi:hypothetical protein